MSWVLASLEQEGKPEGEGGCEAPGAPFPHLTHFPENRHTPAFSSRLLASTPSWGLSLDKVPGGPDGFALAGPGAE